MLLRVTNCDNSDMTGFSAVLAADDVDDDHDRRWSGVARVVGPPWTRLPSLTVGLFGVQMLWSVEMSYGQRHRSPSNFSSD